MYLQKKQLITFIVIFLLVSFSGCIDGQNNDEPKNNLISNEYDFFVDQSYTNETQNWNKTHFSSINSAINKAKDNTSIYVANGLYLEVLVINKNLSLKGEDPFDTIIDGNQMSEDVILVEGNGQLNISGFTIRNCSRGMELSYNPAGIDIRSDGNIIQGNIITDSFYGIYCPYGDNNIVINNQFTEIVEYGAFFLHRSDNNLISQNLFNENIYCALRIKGSYFNTVTNNIFINNPKGLYLCCGSENNTVYNNIFCNGSDWNAYDYLENKWDDGKKGNYWDDFHLDSQGAFDNDSDGIVDYVYSFPFGNSIDHFPIKNLPIISNDFYDKNTVLSCCDK